MTNGQIANVFDEIADILEFQGANMFRVRAYRNAARTIQAGAPVFGDLEVLAYWRDAANTNLKIDTLGVVGGGSGAISAPNLEAFPGATNVLVRARLYINSWNAGTIVRLYADALAVTIP